MNANKKRTVLEILGTLIALAALLASLLNWLMPFSPVGVSPLTMLSTLTPTAIVTLPTINTPYTSLTQTSASTPLPTSTKASCDEISFITDITIVDGETMAPNQPFTKTWRFRNSGTCIWTTNYALVFVSGDQLGGEPVVYLDHNVAPGEMVDISIELQAPNELGRYKSDWVMRNASGELFGLGDTKVAGYVLIDVYNWFFGGNPKGELFFVLDANGNKDIFSLNFAKSGSLRKINLTNNPAMDIEPAVSSNSKLIAFVSDRDGFPAIYTSNLFPEYSFDVYANVQRLTYEYSTSPDWSPDGTMLTYIGKQNDQFDIYIMGAHGENPVNISQTSDYDEIDPDWSPDGNKITYCSNAGGKWRVYIMNKDGSNVIPLTNGKQNDCAPSWVGSGEQIAYTSDRDGNSEIYIMNVDGSNSKNLTQNLATDIDPYFQGESFMFFTSNRDGQWKIYVDDINLGKIIPLSSCALDGGKPNWIFAWGSGK